MSIRTCLYEKINIEIGVIDVGSNLEELLRTNKKKS